MILSFKLGSDHIILYMC